MQTFHSCTTQEVAAPIARMPQIAKWGNFTRGTLAATLKRAHAHRSSQHVDDRWWHLVGLASHQIRELLVFRVV